MSTENAKTITNDYLLKKKKELESLKDNLQNQYFQVLGMIQLNDQYIEEFNNLKVEDPIKSE